MWVAMAGGIVGPGELVHRPCDGFMIFIIKNQPLKDLTSCLWYLFLIGFLHVQKVEQTLQEVTFKP